MIVVHSDLIWAADQPEAADCVDKMDRVWKKRSPNKDPPEYYRVFLLGHVRPFHSDGTTRYTTGTHANLVVLSFNHSEDVEDSIEIWDSGNFKYPHLFVKIREWLEDYEYTKPMKQVYRHSDMANQIDPFNCGQYMVLTARYLFRYEKPDYTDFQEPDWESDPRTLPDKKYLWGREIDFGMKKIRAHPILDETVKRFSQIKVKDYARMMKWKETLFEGFKEPSTDQAV
jgi:hypothetical protein